MSDIVGFACLDGTRSFLRVSSVALVCVDASLNEAQVVSESSLHKIPVKAARFVVRQLLESENPVIRFRLESGTRIYLNLNAIESIHYTEGKIAFFFNNFVSEVVSTVRVYVTEKDVQMMIRRLRRHGFISIKTASGGRFIVYRDSIVAAMQCEDGYRIFSSSAMGSIQKDEMERVRTILARHRPLAVFNDAFIVVPWLTGVNVTSDGKCVVRLGPVGRSCDSVVEIYCDATSDQVSALVSMWSFITSSEA